MTAGTVLAALAVAAVLIGAVAASGMPSAPTRPATNWELICSAIREQDAELERVRARAQVRRWLTPHVEVEVADLPRRRPSRETVALAVAGVVVELEDRRRLREADDEARDRGELGASAS